MELDKAISSRKTIRKFQNKSIPDNYLYEISLIHVVRL